MCEGGGCVCVCVCVCVCAGVDLSFSVDLNTTPACQVPDVLVYVAQYMCSDDRREEGSTMTPEDSTGQPVTEPDSWSTDGYTSTFAPDPDQGRGMRQRVPPNPCT